MKSFPGYVTFCSILLSAAAIGQTFEVGGQEQNSAPQKPAAVGKKSSPASGEIGWGSSIEVGRLARAADTALAKGDYTGAANYADRAVHAAPQDPQLWFLLGYSSRLAGRYNASLDAYKSGLSIKPSSVEGLSGMAQTYARMGQIDEAKRLLTQVIAANPKRDNDLLLAGELFMQTAMYSKDWNICNAPKHEALATRRAANGHGVYEVEATGSCAPVARICQAPFSK